MPLRCHHPGSEPIWGQSPLWWAPGDPHTYHPARGIRWASWTTGTQHRPLPGRSPGPGFSSLNSLRSVTIVSLPSGVQSRKYPLHSPRDPTRQKISYKWTLSERDLVQWSQNVTLFHNNIKGLERDSTFSCRKYFLQGKWTKSSRPQQRPVPTLTDWERTFLSSTQHRVTLAGAWITSLLPCHAARVSAMCVPSLWKAAPQNRNTRWPRARLHSLSIKEVAAPGMQPHPRPVVAAPWELCRTALQERVSVNERRQERGREGARLQFPRVHWAWAFSIPAEYEESWPCFKDFRKRRQFKATCLHCAVAVPLAGCNLSRIDSGNSVWGYNPWAVYQPGKAQGYQ